MKKNSIKKNAIYRPLSKIILEPISRGFSVSVISAYKSGKTSWIRDLAQDSTLISSEYKNTMKNLKFIWIVLDSLEKNMMSDFIDELNKFIEDGKKLSASASWREIKDAVGCLVDKEGERVIFIIVDAQYLFDTYSQFGSNLAKVCLENKPNVNFLFLVTSEVDSSNITDPLLSDIQLMLFSNMKYFPLISKDMIMEFVQNSIEEMKLKLSDDEINSVVSLSGNHIAVLRAIFRQCAKSGEVPNLEKVLNENIEVRGIFLRIWTFLTEETQLKIKENVEYTNEFLLNTGLKAKDGKWFSEVFGEFVKKILSKDQNISVDDITKLLSWQELSVFNLLKENTGEVVSRDDIAEVIWGDNWVDNYSEWMVEKVLSNIRKKTSVIKELRIKTVPKKGYCLLGDIE